MLGRRLPQAGQQGLSHGSGPYTGRSGPQQSTRSAPQYDVHVSVKLRRRHATYTSFAYRSVSCVARDRRVSFQEEVMRTLFLNPPSYDDFDGGAGARYQAKREVWSFWYPTWLSYPAGMLPGARLLDAPPEHMTID